MTSSDIGAEKMRMGKRLSIEIHGLWEDILQFRNPKAWMDLFRYLLILFLCCTLMSFAVYLFFKPATLGTSGFSGIALLLDYVFHTNISDVYFYMNVPFVIWGFFLLGRRFVLHSAAGISVFYLCLKILEPLQNLHQYHVQNEWISILFGGFLFGLGAGFALKMGGNTGGVDLVALINRYFTGIKLNYTIWAFDSSVILFAWYKLGTGTVLYTLANILVYTTTMRIVLEGFHRSRTVV
ncbi:YitT family protein [Pasteuria penetrans]|uniref:YitT family protein n=1 Tax=Pasteuria penetrans TaxID=86005 RepID=UPI000F92441E|nr:YitT family protein [Pasteuria penetrans]